ncbi:MAG: potassium channel beta subunit family protein [Alkalispirochaetaceae bacterium]
MNYRRLGRSGLKVSELSFGAWVTFQNQMQVDEAKKCMIAAYEAGVNFFDNAEAYARGKAEIIMGEVLRDTRWRRDSYVVSSKVFFGGVDNPGPNQKGLSRKHIVEACDQALERMGVDYLDLYYCHRPDPEVPVEETVRGMSDLISQGKVLYWGTSEWSATEIMEAYGVARQYNLVPPTMEQPQYNMFHRQKVEVEFAPLYERIGLGTTTWSPLASGLLTGKYNDGIPEGSRLSLEGYEFLKQLIEGNDGKSRIEKVKKLTTLAEELGATTAQLAIAWLLKNRNVSTVITGASRVSQVEQNLKATDLVEKLDDSVMERIEEILQNKPGDAPFLSD